jgi:hypothetical protein
MSVDKRGFWLSRIDNGPPRLQAFPIAGPVWRCFKRRTGTVSVVGVFSACLGQRVKRRVFPGIHVVSLNRIEALSYSKSSKIVHPPTILCIVTCIFSCDSSDASNRSSANDVEVRKTVVSRSS